MWISHTKKWQRVLSFYQEPFRYFPSKVLVFWRIKIKKYPQELPEGEERQKKKNYDGWLVNIQLRYPKIMFKWQLYLAFKWNDVQTSNWFTFFKYLKRKPLITKVPIDNKESVEDMAKRLAKKID